MMISTSRMSIRGTTFGEDNALPEPPPTSIPIASSPVEPRYPVVEQQGALGWEPART
jgi:hypothetical protein